MKTKYFLPLFALAAMSFTACSEYEDEYTAAAPGKGDAYVGFSASNVQEVEAETGKQSFEVELKRNMTTGAIDVPVKVMTATPEVVSVADPVAHFTDGSNVAYVTVNLDNSENGETYQVKLSIDESATNPYIAQDVAMSYTAKITTYQWETIDCMLSGSYFFGAGNAVPAKLMRPQGGNKYRLLKPFYSWFEGKTEAEIEAENLTCPIINFEVHPADESVTFDSFFIETGEDGAANWGWWPAELSSSLADYASYSAVMAPNVVRLAPYVYSYSNVDTGLCGLTITLTGDNVFVAK